MAKAKTPENVESPFSKEQIEKAKELSKKKAKEINDVQKDKSS